MTGPRLHEHRPCFDETNDFVDFILGLSCLAPPALGKNAPAPPRDDSPTPSTPEEGFMHLVLGLLGLMEGFERLVTTETRESPQDEKSPSPNTAHGSLLR